MLRGYGPKKVEENVQAEIMQVILDETAESYKEEIIHVLEVSSHSHYCAHNSFSFVDFVPYLILSADAQSNTADDVEANVTFLCEWIQQHSG